ncbi:hypothetical protein C4D60_Mb09t13180 [Musa balbisiana]|uniref:Uncharacterized protein n=1 Tax=Musa balbisiana TaxID=52838 RepID=A0A4V4H380_MUSBA|nr:hypothetical protein C4D60_Mb09t13180 [Musa balbisiana]
MRDGSAWWLGRPRNDFNPSETTLPSSSTGNPNGGGASLPSSPLIALSVFFAILRRISPPPPPYATRISTGSAPADLASPRNRRLPRLIP